MIPTLFQLAHSPWSLKARCALAHHQIEVNVVEYRPFLDEPRLRFRLLRAGSPWLSRITVPMLFTNSDALRDSWQIARYAEQHGSGQPLIPHAEEVASWNALSDRILNAGRARFMHRALAHEDVMREFVPGAASGLPAAAVRASIRAFNAKYGIRRDGLQQAAREIRDGLDALRAALSDGRRYLLGTLSYADFAMGIAMQVLRSLPGAGFGPASERIAQEPELIEAYPDLLAWRDRLHAQHDLLPELRRTKP